LSIYNIQTTWLQNTCQCKGSWIQLQKKKTKPLFLSTLCSCRGKTLVDSQEHKFDMLSGDESSNLSIDSANPTPISGVSREHWTRFKDCHCGVVKLSLMGQFGFSSSPNLPPRHSESDKTLFFSFWNWLSHQTGSLVLKECPKSACLVFLTFLTRMTTVCNNV
jgi:hypothetical protein